eukprot:3926760-Alexandrium_andersonii.AAC.1
MTCRYMCRRATWTRPKVQSFERRPSKRTCEQYGAALCISKDEAVRMNEARTFGLYASLAAASF